MNINTNYISTNTPLNSSLNSSALSERLAQNETLAQTQDLSNNLTNAQISSDFSQTTYASEFGFRVNEQGVFEKELNKAANIPLSYEINIKSMQSIAKEMMSQNSNLTPSKIDMPELLNKYYSALKSVESEFTTQDNAYLSRAEIMSLHQGFSTNNGEFEDEIVRIYSSADEINQALEQNKSLNPLGLDNKIVNFSFDKTINNTSNNEFIKPYLTKDSTVSKSGLLMNFAYEDIKSNNENADKFFFKPLSTPTFSSHQNLYRMLRNEGSFDEFVRKENEQRISFDLYLYMNGVSKQTASNEKIMLFYQQYLSYQKNMNIQDFTNSSSIYQLYTQSLSNEFKGIQNEFNTQNDSEKLSLANEARQNSLDSFFTQRTRQAKLDNIIKSYMSVMS